jgi:hypothetical protein
LKVVSYYRIGQCGKQTSTASRENSIGSMKRGLQTATSLITKETLLISKLKGLVYFDDFEWFETNYGTKTLLYLLRKSYALIYMLLTHSQPVSEALLPIYNQLKTLRKCLLEVKDAGGVSSSRELYPYGMKVSDLDSNILGSTPKLSS